MASKIDCSPQEKRREVEVLKNLVQRSQSEIAQRDDRPVNLHRATSTHSNVTANNTSFEHTSILWWYGAVHKGEALSIRNPGKNTEKMLLQAKMVNSLQLHIIDLLLKRITCLPLFLFLALVKWIHRPICNCCCYGVYFQLWSYASWNNELHKTRKVRTSLSRIGHWEQPTVTDSDPLAVVTPEGKIQAPYNLCRVHEQAWYRTIIILTGS